MSIITSTKGITLRIEQKAAKEPLSGIDADVYQAVLDAYEACIDDDFVTAIPTFRRTFYYFGTQMAYVLARRMAESDAECHDFKNKKDFEDDWSGRIEDFFGVFNHISYEWLLYRVFRHADLCFVDTDIECCSEKCANDYGFDEPCVAEFVVSNSPQANLWPMGGGDHVRRDYLANPLANPWENPYHVNVINHRMTKKCGECIANAELCDIDPWSSLDEAYEHYIQIYEQEVNRE